MIFETSLTGRCGDDIAAHPVCVCARACFVCCVSSIYVRKKVVFQHSVNKERTTKEDEDASKGFRAKKKKNQKRDNKTTCVSIETRPSFFGSQLT